MIQYTPVHQNDSNLANMQESVSLPRHLAEDSNSFTEGQKNQDAISENRMTLAASSTRSTKGRRILLAGWGWILECMYLVLAIGALAAMVSVVATAQDEPIGPWRDSHLNVSINTVVAILSAILTGTCTFIVGEGTTMCSRVGQSPEMFLALIHGSDWSDKVAVVRETSQTSRLRLDRQR
jgi:hypothetical protein